MSYRVHLKKIDMRKTKTYRFWQAKSSIVGLYLAIMLLSTSCSKNNLKIDVSDIEIDQKVVRFDTLLFASHPDTVLKNVPTIINRYPQFSELYFHRIIKIGDPSKKTFYDMLSLFLSEYDLQMAYLKSEGYYGNFSPYYKVIHNGFKHYHYYFPELDIPDIYLMMTGFNQSVVAAQNILGIGVDKFLGEEARFYDQLQISKYLRKRMIPKALPYEAMKGWTLTEFQFNDSVNNLISHMVYHGKILYLMDAFFPQAHDSVKIAWQGKDITWCKKSESEVWSYMIDKKILFDNNRMLIKRFVEDAPFTAPFSRQSPGRVGQWIGWQIVRSYMKKHPDITIPELMAKDDYHTILLESGYNP